MSIQTDYQDYESYINSMKNYQTTQGRRDVQTPYAQEFEAIYNEAKKQEIGLSDAKEFLKSLSSDEIRTLQKYSGLADSINIDAISAEGAYNLLLPDNEQYDFNSDGVAEVGEAKHLLSIPTNMPVDVRDAYISAMNSMSDKEKLMSMTLSFDKAYLVAKLNNESYTPTTIDYNYLKNSVENSLNPKGGGFISAEASAVIQKFWDAFNSAYTGDTSEKEFSERNSSDAVSQFLQDLHTKGAAQFLADLNTEKIDKLVDEYKEKLIKEMGETAETTQKIAQLVENYKKELLDEMREKTEDKQKSEGEKATIVSKNSFVQIFLEMQQETKSKPLESLLT